MVDLVLENFCESRVELNTKKTNKKDGIKANNSNRRSHQDLLKNFLISKETSGLIS